MNVYTMKLDTKHLTIPNEDKSKDTSGQKKCKAQKKKNISSSSDKDALLNNNGLGHKFNDRNDLNTHNFNPSVKNDCTKRVKAKKECPKIDKMFTESDKIQDRLQGFLSTEHKDKIMCILNDIRSLSDIEKLYLYLQLPTGSPFEVDPFKQKIQNPLGKKADEEGMFAVTWIQSHLEEDPDVSLPKQEVYDEYQSYCNMRGTDALCAADFGKVMKQIFPSVKPRRLGTRGNSRYCYSGLRKKLKLAPPSVPDMQKEKERCLEEKVGDEVTSAACHLLFEWTEKLLGIRFSSLKELAAHLLENMYVDNRSVAAFTLLLDASPHLISKGFAPEGGGAKKSEAQFHLQRKIQEKELIKEQKRKLQEQRTSLVGRGGGKGASPKKKGSGKLARKATKTVPGPPKESESDKNFENTDEDKHKENELPSNCTEPTTELVISPELDIKQENSFYVPHATSPKVLDPPLSSLVLSPLSSSSNGTLGEMEEAKIFISQNKTPVCIAQSLPGIILVPSLPQLSGDIGKQNANLPKYKRIQPKPLQGDTFTRSRAGSVGSSLPSKPKARNVDGRRSSHAWLQSENIVENGEEKLLKNIFSSADSSFRSIQEKKTVLQSAVTLKDDIRFETPHNLVSQEQLESMLNISPDTRIILNEKRKKLLEPKSNPIPENSSLETEDSNSTKRHLDEKDEHADNKRVHLDPFKLSCSPSTLAANKISNAQTSNKQYTRDRQEEVSVPDIEGDALNDYFRGGSSIPTPILSLQQQFSSNTKVQQLSQLRMLLEQNLPSAVSKMPTSSVKIQKVFKRDEDASETTQINISENIEKSFTPIVPASSKLLNTDIFFQNQVDASNVADGPLLKNDSLERLLTLPFQIVSETQADNQLLSDPNVFLNNVQGNIQDMDISLHSELNQSLSASDILLPSSTLLSGTEFVEKQGSAAAMSNGRVSTCTQVPSVPQSPNTRRRAFNFMPISPRQTPIPDGANGLSSMSSSHLRTMISTAVGPSQPPSNSGSPFVSPRSTPVPLCRSRHSSGQSSCSTSRHTPFQNFDSGVSSVSSSPFISPQPTPVPVSRLRHNSSKTVAFCSVNTPELIHSAGPLLRTRHSSGPGAPHTAICSPRSSSLSPLVSESSFVFPSSNEVRSRHSSGSNTTTPMSPISEQASSSSSCTSNIPDISSAGDVSLSQSFLNDGAGDLLISANPTSFKQVRHRHASSSVVYGKTSFMPRDIFSQEIQKLLKNYQENGTPDALLSNRSQSVPLHQMLQNADSYCLLPQPVEDASTKSHPSTPVMNQMFSFPLLSSNICADVSGKDKIHTSHMEWTETGSVRRNLTTLYDAPPPSDDLQTTLEDLRDCDTDFSKLELELRQNEESGL